MIDRHCLLCGIKNARLFYVNYPTPISSRLATVCSRCRKQVKRYGFNPQPQQVFRFRPK